MEKPDFSQHFSIGGLDEQQFKDKLKWIYELTYLGRQVSSRSQEVSAFWDGKTFETWDDFMNSDRTLRPEYQQWIKELDSDFH